MAEINKNEKFKLDLKDRKILYELDKNARQPASKIAKKVGLSQEVVNYRIKKLEQGEIITQYQLALDLSKLGVIHFKIALSFHHIKAEKLEEVIEKLKKDNKVKWIVSCKGSWDLIVDLEPTSISELDDTKDKILSLFEGYIDKKAIALTLDASVFNRDYLISKTNIDRRRILVSQAKKEKIDELDMEIIKRLSENSRKPVVELASELKISPRIANYRINQLLKKKIISGFRIAINYKKLGIQFYKTFIYLDNPKPERVSKLIRYFESNPNIIHHVKVLGNWDLEPEFEVYSEQEFDNLLRNMKDEFSDIIKNVDIVTISKEHKFVYL